MTRRFTLLELIVSVTLGVILVGVAARVFQTGMKTYTRSLERIDSRRVLEGPARDLHADGSATLAVIDLENWFAPKKVEQTLRSGDTARTDELEWVVLQGTPPALDRVRYFVRDWDTESESGTLVREQRPVLKSDLPEALEYLSSLTPTSERVVLSGVTCFEIIVQDDPSTRVEPPLNPSGWADKYRVEGTLGKALHDRLKLEGADLSVLSPGSLIFLESDRIDPSAPRGYYPIQSVHGETLRLGLRIGSDNKIAYRAAFLPQAVVVRMEVGSSEGPARLEVEVGLRSGNPTRRAQVEAAWRAHGIPGEPKKSRAP
jgi:hypothetical protein